MKCAIIVCSAEATTFVVFFFLFSVFSIPALCVLDLQFYVMSLEFGILVSGTKHKLYFQMVHLIFCVGFNVGNRMT